MITIGSSSISRRWLLRSYIERQWVELGPLLRQSRVPALAGSLALHLAVPLMLIVFGLLRHQPGNQGQAFTITLLSEPNLTPIASEARPSTVVEPSASPAHTSTKSLPQRHAHAAPKTPGFEPPAQQDEASRAASSAAAPRVAPSLALSDDISKRIADEAQRSAGDGYIDLTWHWLETYRKVVEHGLGVDDSGGVRVEFSVLRDGTVVDAQVIESSGRATVDAAALELLRDASPVPPFPDELKLDRLTLREWFHFVRRAGN